MGLLIYLGIEDVTPRVTTITLDALSVLEFAFVAALWPRDLEKRVREF